MSSYQINCNDNNVKIAVNKSLCKEYQKSDERVVYLNNNTEFQLQLYNPYSYVVGIKIKFNDYDMSSTHLILRPGERVWLDRFIDDDKKLLFSTYDVDNDSQTENAIKNNGKIEVSFFREYKNSYAYTPYTPFVSSITISPLDNTWYYTNTDTSGVTYSASSATYNNSCTCNYCATAANTIETGRIEHGNRSSQKFNHVNYDFESYAFRIERIHIFPESQRPVSSNDLKKKYCHACGHKLNTKFKYCPYCGAKQ